MMHSDAQRERDRPRAQTWESDPQTWGCARVTAGPKRPHLGVCPGPNIPLQGRQGPRGLPGESQGQRSLVSYSPWGHKESDMNEQLSIRTSLH